MRHAPGRKADLVVKIRMAEQALGLTGTAKLGPLYYHTVAELKELYRGLYRHLEQADLLNTKKEG